MIKRIFLFFYIMSSIIIFTENEGLQPRFNIKNIWINNKNEKNKNNNEIKLKNNLPIFSTIKEEDEYKEKEQLIDSIFSAIRRGRNTFVQRQFKTEENLNAIKNIKRNADNFIGPSSDYTIYPFINNELVDINVRNRIGYTPLIVAIESKNNVMVEYLLDNGADIYVEHPIFGKMSLHTAAYYENYEAVKMILERYPEVVNFHSGSDGWLPLQDATLKNNVSIVKYLLDNGADPRAQDYNGGTAVDMATEFGKGEVVKLLRDKMKEKL